MGGLLGELGKKLAERWLTLLVLPGVLFLAIATVAETLGHSHALDIGRLTAQIGTGARNPAVKTVGGQVVLLAVVLIAAAGAGLVAQSLGTVVEQLVLASAWRSWPRPLRAFAQWRTDSRADRWTKADSEYRTQREQAALAATQTLAGSKESGGLARFHRAKVRIAVEAPERPTWSGDRVHAVDVRLLRELRLDIRVLWPLLWLHLPDAARKEITGARDALSRAAVLGGWSLLYVPLAAWWWPSALIAVVIGGTAWSRFRASTDAYALTLEAAVRLHVVDVAKQLGLSHEGPADTALGHMLTRYLRTGLLPALSASKLPQLSAEEGA